MRCGLLRRQLGTKVHNGLSVSWLDVANPNRHSLYSSSLCVLVILVLVLVVVVGLLGSVLLRQTQI